MDGRVGQIRAALAAAGLKSGDRIAIALPNCSDWVAFDIAALSLGLVVVPLYVHDSAANMAFILTHSGARLLVIDTEARWSRLLPHWPELLGLEHIWIRDGLDADSGDLSRPGLRSLGDVLNSVAKTAPERPLQQTHWPRSFTPRGRRASRKEQCSPTAPCSGMLRPQRA